MPIPNRSKLSFKLKLKLVVVSLLGVLLPSACARYTPTPMPPTCYEPVAPPMTATPTTFISPISPLPTPTPSPEARRLLREKLLTEGRFPGKIARQLEG